MNKSTRQKILNAFSFYEENKKTAIDWIASFPSNGLVSQYSGIRTSGGNGNSNERLFIAQADREYTAFRWCKVVEDTITTYYHDKAFLTIIREHLIKRRKLKYLCGKIHTCYATAKNYKEQIILTAELWAQEYHLI